MEDAERYERNSLTVRICYDQDTEHADPRQHDNLGTMFCWHPRYLLGDEQFKNADDYGAVPRKDGLPIAAPQFDSMEQVRDYLVEDRHAVEPIIPLYLLDHSGLAIRAGRSFHEDPGGWDTTMVGFIFTTAHRIVELCGTDEQYHDTDWLDKQLRAEVDEYHLFLSGQVYGYIVEDSDGNQLDSCWGFLGHDYVQEQANEVADSYNPADVELERVKTRLADATRIAESVGATVIPPANLGKGEGDGEET